MVGEHGNLIPSGNEENDGDTKSKDSDKVQGIPGSTSSNLKSSLNFIF